MSVLTKQTQEFINQLEKIRAGHHADKQGHKVHVSELTSLPAFVYEKIRNIIDYKDEFLLRKNAINRFLKRKFLLLKFAQKPEEVALSLVRELVLSRYLKNDTVLESTIGELAKVIEKYYSLFDELKNVEFEESGWREQLIGIAAVECDTHLVSPAERHAYTSYAFHLVENVIELPDFTSTAEVKNVQLVIAIQRVLERADKDIIFYHLLRHYFKDWFTLEPGTAAKLLAPELPKYLNIFQEIAFHDTGRRLMPHVKSLLVPLIIFRDLAHKYDGSVKELVVKPNRVEHLARETYIQHWKTMRQRIRNKGFHAMGYIFMTKMLMALLIELPYEQFAYSAINYVPIAINLAFPPFLMALITIMIKSPDVTNREHVVKGIMEMLYSREPDFYKIRRVKTLPPKFIVRFSYALLYSITMVITFGLLVYILRKMNFNIVSGAFFIFFVSLVSFFGISLRTQARYLKVRQGRESMLGFIFDFFTLPIVSFGKWLSTTFDRVNIFVFLLDFFFEVPFKTVLKIFEKWFSFLSEKKDDLY